ncbi:MAG: carbohydrate kinase, partial [Anaerolineae bacterium]|nr:carbohydrate kinase [Anaerolineae bacterium]
ASLEAVAYRIALVYDDLRALLPGQPQIVVSGGALASSPAWLQVVADALGRTLTLSAAPEASARGAALLALEAIGALPGIDQAPDFLGATAQPDMQRHEVYRRAIMRQQELYDRLVRDPL